MITLLPGPTSADKTKKMIEIASECVRHSGGDIFFITNNHRIVYDLQRSIKTFCTDDYVDIGNNDQIIGFIYGLIAGNSNTENIFIDNIIKKDVLSSEDTVGFMNSLKKISQKYNINMVVSLNVETSELGDSAAGCEIYK